MMASEDLVNILVHTDVTRYLEFKQIGGSYVFRDKKIAKLPATESEAITSSLMGLFEKNRARQFFGFVRNYDENEPKTQQGFFLSLFFNSKIQMKKKKFFFCNF